MKLTTCTTTSSLNVQMLLQWLSVQMQFHFLSLTLHWIRSLVIRYIFSLYFYANWWGIWIAILTEEEPHKEVRVKWTRLSGVLKMNPLDSTAIPRPPSAAAQQNGATHKVNEYCIVFVGFNLQEQNLRDWLKTCCKPVCDWMSWYF